MTIHERIEQLILAAGLTVSSAGKACGLDPSTIRKFIEAQTLPSGRTLQKLAKGLNSTPEWIVSGAGDGGPKSAFSTALNTEPVTPVASLPKIDIPTKHDTSYIQVAPSVLHRYVSGALQNESIPEEQADAYADAVLELIKGRTSAHVVLRLEE